MAGTFKSVMGWIGGIAAGVLVPVLVFHLTKSAPEPPAAPTITLEGRVVDNSSSKFLHGAHVKFRAEDDATEQETDSQGRYLFIIHPKQAPVVGQLRIQLKGYQDYDLTQQLNVGDNLWEIPLVAEVVAPPAAGGASGSSGSIGPTPPGGLTATPAANLPPRVVLSLPAYIRRDTAAMVGQVSQKK